MFRKMVLCLLVILFLVSPAIATDKYNYADGEMDDWGITFQDIIDGLSGYENDWIPSGDNIDWIVEDNVDPNIDTANVACWSEDTGCGCEYATGVHINGEGSDYSIYYEPSLEYTCSGCGSDEIAQPSGGEKYDIEAAYFDDDKYNLYFALVVSNNEGLGDLYLNTGNGEYGIVVISHDNGDFAQGEIYKDPEWKDDYYKESDSRCYWKGLQRTTIESGQYVGDASLQLTLLENNGNVIEDNGYPNYLIEIKIPRQLVGSPPEGTGNVGYAFTCGNDIIDKDLSYNYETVPEFSTIAIPVIGMLAIVLIMNRRRQ